MKITLRRYLWMTLKFSDGWLECFVVMCKVSAVSSIGFTSHRHHVTSVFVAAVSVVVNTHVNVPIINIFLLLRYQTTTHRCWTFHCYIQCESKKSPQKFSDIFSKRFGNFSPNYTRLLYIPIYARLHIFIRFPATLTKLCHNKRDHHNVLKMSTIDRKARWVVALNMA